MSENNKNNYRMPPPAQEPPAGLPPETSRRILQEGSAEPPAALPPETSKRILQEGLPPGTSKRILQAGSPEELEYEEEFEIQITTQKGSSIKIETSSYDKLDDLLDKAFTTYKRLTKEESRSIGKKQ